jgi:putative membrane protein
MSNTQNEIYGKENKALGKKLTILVWIITGAVLFLVCLMREVKIELPQGVTFYFLPPLHAILNATAACSLIMAIISIKRKQIINHKRWIYLAMGCSFIFLLSYVVYHFTTPETLFGDLDKNGLISDEEKESSGVSRIIYLIILLSHILLAAISLPFILLTFVYGFTNQITKHRRMAKKVFPVWLYVAITGPVVYLLLQPYY